MGRQFEPGRALEVTFPRYGSAYYIGGRLVLTAAHLLDEVGSDCCVRAKQSFGEVKANVVWKAQKSDIALIELPKSITLYSTFFGEVIFGKLPEATAGETLKFQMYGWPQWGWTRWDHGPAAGGRQVEGIIYLADTSPENLLVLEALRLPPEALSESGSNWEGSSGAAIICDGLVIAVQRQHQNPRRPASLEASPLWTIYSDEQWCGLLRQHGINPEPAIARLRIARFKTDRTIAETNLNLDQEAVIENAKWVDNVIVAGISLAGIIVLIKMFGGSEIEWQGIKLSTDFGWLFFTFFTLAHAYTSWLFNLSIRDLVERNSFAICRKTFDEITAIGGFFFRRLLPRTEVTGIIAGIKIVGMCSSDPTVFLAYSCAILLLAAIIPFEISNVYLFLFKIIIAFVIVIGNWMIGSNWVVNLSKLTIKSDSRRFGSRDSLTLAPLHFSSVYPTTIANSRNREVASIHLISTGVVTTWLIIPVFLISSYFGHGAIIIKTVTTLLSLILVYSLSRNLAKISYYGKVLSILSILVLSLTLFVLYWLWI